MQTSFYNTIHLSNEDLKDAVKKARGQEDAILIIYKNRRKPWTPSDILTACNKAGHQWPLTSIRRAISNLTKSNDLNMTSNKKKGLYGQDEHYWIINAAKHPTPSQLKPQELNFLTIQKGI